MDTKDIAANAKQVTADNMNFVQGGKVCPPQNNVYDLSLLNAEQARAWQQNGFFVLKGLAEPDLCLEMTERAIGMFVDAETDAEMSFDGHHKGKNGAIAIEEGTKLGSSERADMRMSKLYNLHRTEPYHSFAQHPAILNAMHAIIGPRVAVFNSQYIFKNPDVWGQPWHQDSLYFFFDRVPQIGVWLATSRATIENGCLFVAPGSHLEPIHEHLPDARPGANYGYVEVVDYDFSKAEPVLMEAGDVLIFHSFLMHMSNDNNSKERRSALVFHYGDADTQVVEGKSSTVDFMAV
jgi:phytanoyl-CoA hydroxylase